MGYNISLRNSEAQLVEIDRNTRSKGISSSNGVIFSEDKNGSWLEKSKHIQVALVGNPNSGKTTLFNIASGSKEKVANYAGVTVDSKGIGIKKLFDKIINVYENREPDVRHIHINYGIEIENSICVIQSKIKIEENRAFTNIISARYLAIELIENDEEFSRNITRCINSGEIIHTSKNEYLKLEKLFSDPVETVVTDLR